MHRQEGWTREQKFKGWVEVVSVVHDPLKDIDTKRINSPNLTLVIVDVVKGKGQATSKYKFFCGKGQLKNMYART